MLGANCRFLSELLRLRARGDRAPRRAQGRVAGCAASGALPSLSSGRLRSGSLKLHAATNSLTIAFMDTQRLILFVIFSFSALFLWEAWQREHRPPVPPIAQPRRRSKVRMRSRVPAAAAPPAVPGGYPARRRRPPRRPARQIVIKTDLYTARRRHARCGPDRAGAERASRHARRKQAVCPAAARMPSARSSRRRGCSARACRIIAPCGKRFRGRANSLPGANSCDVKLQATAANGDKVVQTLTFHRGSYVIDVAYDITNAGTRADRSLRVFPVHARHQGAGCAELDGARRVHRPGHLQRDRQVQEGRFRRARQARRRSRAQAALHQERRQRLGRHGRALFRRRLAAVRQTAKRRASSTRGSSTTACTPMA